MRGPSMSRQLADTAVFLSSAWSPSLVIVVGTGRVSRLAAHRLTAVVVGCWSLLQRSAYPYPGIGDIDETSLTDPGRDPSSRYLVHPCILLAQPDHQSRNLRSALLGFSSVTRRYAARPPARQTLTSPSKSLRSFIIALIPRQESGERGSITNLPDLSASAA